jgi:hypothetical protein
VSEQPTDEELATSALMLERYGQPAVGAFLRTFIGQGGGKELYWANITHNLGQMAQTAGLYDVVWYPDQNGITTAEQLIPILDSGIKLMEATPSRFQKLSSKNGWGMYEHFLPWLRRYLTACQEHPKARVRVSR